MARRFDPALLERHGKLRTMRIEYAAPPELLEPGILRATEVLSLWQDWSDACMPRQQPVISMLAGLATFSAIMGRSFRGPTNCVSPLSILVLAPPGAGKDHPQEMARHIMREIGLEGHLCADKWGSAQGLERELQTNGERLSISDEFADAIEAFCHANCPAYKKDILTIIKKIYNGNDYHGTAISDGAATRTCKAPRMAILASAQPKVFWASVTPRVISDGFLSRMITLAAMRFGPIDHNRRIVSVAQAMPLALKDALLERMKNAPTDPETGMPVEYRIPYRDSAATERAKMLTDHYHERYERFLSIGYEHEAALVGRSFERLIRLAAVFAWTEKSKDISVSVDALEWSHAIVNASDRCVLAALSDQTDETATGKKWNIYKRIIRSAGPAGISTSSLVARTKMSKYDHASLISQMLLAKVITTRRGKRGGTLWVWIGNEDPLEPSPGKDGDYDSGLRDAGFFSGPESVQELLSDEPVYPGGSESQSGG